MVIKIRGFLAVVGVVRGGDPFGFVLNLLGVDCTADDSPLRSCVTSTPPPTTPLPIEVKELQTLPADGMISPPAIVGIEFPVWDFFSPSIMRILEAQTRHDRISVTSAPLLHYNVEYPVINGERIKLELGRRLGRNQFSTIYKSENPRNLLIKYQCNCENLFQIHPLLRDFWVMKHLRSTGVTPRAYFVSPAARFPPVRTQKTDFSAPESQQAGCMRYGVVRYLVMDRGKCSMYQLAQMTVDYLQFDQVMQIVILTILQLQKMHDLGIIHGDIHPGNVILMEDDGWDIRLIDFGSSMFEDELEMADPMERAPNTYVHCYFSHWNIAGYRFSYRDDIYKALLMGAFLLNGVEFMDYCRGLESDVEKMIEFKQYSFFFEYPGGRDWVLGLRVPPSARGSIVSNLREALDLIRGVHMLDQKPPYRAILNELKSAALIYRRNLLV